MARLLRRTAAATGEGRSAPAAALVSAIERLCDEHAKGIILLVEEPELFLPPQSQRYLHRLLRTFAEAGNQVLYSTHSAAFLDVGRLDELALVELGPGARARRSCTRSRCPAPPASAP